MYVWVQAGGCSRYFFFQAEDGIRVYDVTGVQTCVFRSPVEDEDEAIWQQALMSLQIPESIIADLPRLYPDEWDDLNRYTDLSEPVFFGPRFMNLNVTEVPAV